MYMIISFVSIPGRDNLFSKQNSKVKSSIDTTKLNGNRKAYASE